MSATIQERVARGVAWLDDVRPGWRDQIDLDALDLGSMTLCVMGQVFADDLVVDGNTFEHGFIRGCYARATSGNPHTSVEMGFTGDISVGALFNERMERTAEWRRVIHASRVPTEAVTA